MTERDLGKEIAEILSRLKEGKYGDEGEVMERARELGQEVLAAQHNLKLESDMMRLETICRLSLMNLRLAASVAFVEGARAMKASTVMWESILESERAGMEKPISERYISVREDQRLMLPSDFCKSKGLKKGDQVRLVTYKDNILIEEV